MNLRPTFTFSLGSFALALVGAGAWAAPAPIHFKQACAPGKQIVIGAIGDVLLHMPLQKQADELEGQGRFKTLWSGIEDLMSRPSVTYANLEGPAAYGLPTGSYPAFNYRPEFVIDLKASGVDVVSTANNHALDRGIQGVDRTIDSLVRYGLHFTGTRKSTDSDPQWYTVTHAEGFNIAWLACTWGTNGIQDQDHQVLNCFQDTSLIEQQIHELATHRDIDAVIVTPHWGEEYKLTPNPSQRFLAAKFLNAGALAIIGSHPHVLEPIEKVEVNGSERLIAYSMGNFISGQRGLEKQTSMLLYLGLTRQNNGTVSINGVRHVPLYMMEGRASRYTVTATDRNQAAPPESLALVRSLISSENEIRSDENLVTNPGCS